MKYHLRVLYEERFQIPPRLQWTHTHWAAPNGCYVEDGIITPLSNIYTFGLEAFAAGIEGHQNAFRKRLTEGAVS